MRKNTNDIKESSPHGIAMGWQEDDPDWIYIGKNGETKTDSWEKSGDHWFYLGSDGHLVKDELVESDGDTYYVDHNGAMVENKFVITDMGKMYFGGKGKAIMEGNIKISDTVYTLKEGIVIKEFDYVK